MSVRAVPMRSCPDAACPKPWVTFSRFEVAAGVGVEFTVTEVNGPAASPECAKVDAAKERTLEGKRSLSFDLTAPTEKHALAISLDGEIELVPLSKQRPVYYAHLAFVDPVTGDAEVLAFVPEVGEPA